MLNMFNAECRELVQHMLIEHILKLRANAIRVVQHRYSSFVIADTLRRNQDERTDSEYELCDVALRVSKSMTNSF